MPLKTPSPTILLILTILLPGLMLAEGGITATETLYLDQPDDTSASLELRGLTTNERAHLDLPLCPGEEGDTECITCNSGGALLDCTIERSKAAEEVLLSGISHDGDSLVLNFTVRYSSLYKDHTYTIRPTFVAVLPEGRVRIPELDEEDISFQFTMSINDVEEQTELLNEVSPRGLPGTAVRLPMLEGVACAAELMDGDKLFAAVQSMECRDLYLIIPPEARHKVQLRFYRIEFSGAGAPDVTMAERELVLDEADIAGTVSTTRSYTLPGQIVSAEVSANGELVGCTARIVREGRVYQERYFRPCHIIELGTATDWPAGVYELSVTLYGDGAVGQATGLFTLVRLQGGEEPAPVAMRARQSAVMAGEDIEVLISAPGDHCIIELESPEGISFARQYSRDCGQARIRTEPSYRPGNYVVRISSYSGGILLSSRSEVVSITPWHPTVSEVDVICGPSGSLAFEDIELPCISVGQRCISRRESSPNCVCTRGGDIVDVCLPGQQCHTSGCRGEEIPFAVTRESGSCTISVFHERLPCIEWGQTCSRSSCVCLDDEDRPRERCMFGQACTAEGCIRYEFGASILDVAGSVTEASLIAGLAHVVVELHVYTIDNDGRRAPVEDQGSVRVDAYLGPLPASVTPKGRVGGGSLAYGLTFSGSMSAGVYGLRLFVSHRGQTVILSQTFPVWFAGDNRLLIKPIRVTPRYLSLDAIETAGGGEVEVTAKVVDMNGIEHQEIPAYAFSIDVPGFKPELTSRFDHERGVWSFRVGLEVPEDPGDGRRSVDITLHADHLMPTKTSVAVRGAFVVGRETERHLRIVKVLPGDLSEPLFHALAAGGFDMDVLIDVANIDASPNTLSVYLRSPQPSNKVSVSYIRPSPEGLHIMLQDVCVPQALPGTHMNVYVVHDPTGLKDQTAVPVEENPGGWKSMRGGC